MKPFYDKRTGSVVPTFELTREVFAMPPSPSPASHTRATHVPKGLKRESKDVTIKVQIPINLAPGGPGASYGGFGNLFVYTKNRDFVCAIRREDGAEAYDRVLRTVTTKGVGGAKAYFAATLQSKDELVIKVSDVLAAQPF